MPNVTLTNGFHNTETVIRPKRAGNARCWISNRTASRARKALCGIKGCTCGGNFGERPALEAVPDDQAKGWFIHADFTGAICIKC